MLPPLKNSPFDSSSGQDAAAGGHERFVLQNRWQIIAQLGRGGMGTVYLAEDLRLANRQCVVKKLRDDFFHEEDKEKALAFFQREAVVLSRLQHPNIVHILDYFEEDGGYFLVMDYVDGENLQQMLHARGEPFAEREVLGWSYEIASVLDYLHSHDPPVIYRDLKPSNIMIDSQGMVKVVDFGIARPYIGDTDNTHVVSAGYSPPEQYYGAADPRSDIYALGATMHFLLTGHEPVALSVSSPRRFNSHVSEATDQIVQHATSQDIRLRQQSAPEIKDQLSARIGGGAATSRTGGMLVAILLAATVALGFVAYTKITDVNRGSAAEKIVREKLERQLEDMRHREQNKEKELELLRRYANSSDKAMPEIRRISSNISPGGIYDKAGRNLSIYREQAIAYREQDEAQSTDPEGLPPFPLESQLPTFDNQ